MPATNGIPPKISGFQSGTWPSVFHHSAAHARYAYPDEYWSLYGEATNAPDSIGIESSAIQSEKHSVAMSVGCLGSNTTAVGAVRLARGDGPAAPDRGGLAVWRRRAMWSRSAAVGRLG